MRESIRRWFGRIPPALPPLDADAEFLRVVQDWPGVAAAFSRLGYDARFEAATAAVIGEMKSLIRAEIDGFDGFLHALSQAAHDIQRNAVAIRYRAEDKRLFDDVCAVAPDQTAVLAVLNRDPVSVRLPFVEEIPGMKNGVQCWLTPVEHSFIRKRAADPARFEALLNQLESMIAAKKPGHIISGISRLRRELHREKASLPPALLALEAQVNDFHAAAIPGSRAKREIYSMLIREALAARYHSDHPQLAAVTRRYLDSPWMRARELSRFLLIGLLDPRVAAVTPVWAGWWLRRRLAVVRNEAGTGNFEGSELARRLRWLEERGLYTSTLVYRLLED